MAAPNVVKQNPNATVAAGGTGVGVALVAILGAVGLDISPELAAVISGGIGTVILFIGRNGIRGVIGRVWRGDTPEPEPPPKPPTRRRK